MTKTKLTENKNVSAQAVENEAIQIQRGSSSESLLDVTIRHLNDQVRSGELRTRHLLALSSSDIPILSGNLSQLATIKPSFESIDAGLVEFRAEQILATSLFDRDFYGSQLTREIPAEPLKHFVREGWRKGLDPHPLFSVAFYLAQYDDVLYANIDPLTHYIERGSKEMRNPHPLFMNYFYSLNAETHDNVTSTWLEHFLHSNSMASPHPIFDPIEYSYRSNTNFSSAKDALISYLQGAWKTGLDISPLFQSEFYLKQIDRKEIGVEPYTHYSIFGVPRWLNPHPLFDAPRYRELAGNVDEKLDPLIHYIWKGEKAGLSPCGLLDFTAQQTEERGSQLTTKSRFWDFLTGALNEKTGVPASFSPQKYRQKYMDERSDGKRMTALEHFRLNGVGTLDRYQLTELDNLIIDIGLVAPRSENSSITETDVPLWREYPGKSKIKKGAANVLLVAHAAAEYLFGSERSFLDMVDALSELGANIYVVLPRNVPDYTNRIRPNCVSVFIVKYDWWRKGVNVSTDAIQSFTKLIDDLSIDVVHANTIMLRECFIAARSCGIPSVVHVRELITQDVDLVNLIGSTVEQIVLDVQSRSDWIIANSETTARVFNKPEMTHVIRNTAGLVFKDLKPFYAGKFINFGMISSNIPKKGVFDFVEVARICRVTAPNARFLLIGPENETTRTIRGSLSEIENNIIFPGYCATPEAAIEQCDVVLSLSQFAESFGRTVLEAMIGGKPVIAYDWGALSELVDPGQTGFLVPFKDVKAVAEAVELLCRNPDYINSMGDRARNVAEQKFGRTAYVNAFGAAYTNILPLHFAQLEDEDSRPFIRKARNGNIHQKMSTLKLAYFCWHFPVPSETFVLNELRVLVQCGVDVIVFCRQSPYKEFLPDFPISFERITSVENLSSRLLETERNMVHAHFTYPTVTNMVWPACEAANIPFTFTAHAQDIFVHKNDQLNRLADIGASDLCLRMFTLSRFHLEFVVDRGFPQQKVIISPNAISVDHFKYRPGQSSDLAKPIRVIGIHRFVAKKGLENLIRAAPLVKDLNVNIEIYGYGDLEEKYRSIVKDEQIDNVIIGGRLTQSEIPDVLATSALFACPSIRTEEGDMDGIPTSLIESMAAGIPVLTTQIAGIADLVVDEISGIICESTPESIAQSIRRFLSLTDLKVRSIVAEARRRVETQHNAETTVQTMLKVWRNEVIDIVIVSWNNLVELKMVVDAIRRNTVLPYHLIICDNMSRREPVPQYLDALWCEEDRVTIIHNNRNAMVGPGTNMAIDQGSGDFIIYVCGKEGMSFANAWEGSIVREFSSKDIGLVGTIGYSPTYLYGEQYATGVRLFSGFRNKQFAIENPKREFGHVQGGLFAIRRAMVQEIGGFSDVVSHDFTDVEYSYYAESCGWKIKASEHVLALFNKSRPTLSQRFHEGVKVAHPVLIGQVSNFSDVVAGKIQHCNICDWYGHADTLHFRCEECGSDAVDRSLFRWLSEGTLMYRRLPAVAVGLEGRMKQIWSEQFQGPNITHSDWMTTLRDKGRLANGDGRMHIIVIRMDEREVSDIRMFSKEIDRLLKRDCRFVMLYDGISYDNFVKLRQSWSECLAIQGLFEVSVSSFVSKAIGYAPVPIVSFQKRSIGSVSTAL